MNFKRFSTSDNQWYDVPYYQHKTATDTLTLPAVIYPNDTSITVGIKGNTTQDGTPTPDNPITPHGTGERTGNLFDIASWITANETTYTKSGNSYTFDLKQSMYSTPYYFSETDIAISISGILKNVSSVNARIELLHANGTVSSVNVITNTVVKSENIYAAGLRFNWSTGGTVTLSNIMLNLGSTALPYEPYGYKVTVSCGDTLTPIYLGEVQTTRRVKKLVLTGQEDWTRTSATKCYYLNEAKGCPTDYLKSNIIITVICSHYKGQTNTSSGSNEVNEGCICFYTGGGYELYIGERTITSATDFKAYLAAQYAAGTPVTVWYVLGTPETGIVNEPLMKIGDYADEIINISVPTIVGTNTFDVDTTVQPSEVTLYYHGWHPITNVHEHNNGAWN